VRVGDVVAGRYRLEAVVGSGSHGVVYRGRCDDGAEVAVKTLRPGLLREGVVRARFEREVTAASRIRHPHVIATLDAGTDPDSGAPYLVQPLLRGVDLKVALLREKRFAPKVAVDLVVPVMAGLIALHREGIVHRDVKPSNIFLVGDEGGGVSPVLIDFGVAKFEREGEAGTVEGQKLGTPAYMAPEQIAGVLDLDGRADLWSIAVVLYELMTGANPFLGRTVAETFERVRKRRPPPLDTLVAEVDPVLAMVVARALEPDRALRYAAMEEFLGAVFDCPTLDAHTPGAALYERHEQALTVQRTDARGTVALLPLLPMHAGSGGGDEGKEAPRVAWVSPSLLEAVGNAPTALAEGYAREAPPRRWGVMAAGAAVVMGAFAAAYGAAGAAGAAGSYEVRVTTRPATATVTWDGARAVGGVTRVVARDGRTHTLRVEAPGHVGATVVFRDEAPPPVVELMAE
jgi:hypothetical protein